MPKERGLRSNILGKNEVQNACSTTWQVRGKDALRCVSANLLPHNEPNSSDNCKARNERVLYRMWVWVYAWDHKENRRGKRELYSGRA